MTTEAYLICRFGLAIRFAGLTWRPVNDRATREMVLDFLQDREYVPFTTTDVADELGVREHKARAAVGWLKLAGYIEMIGWHGAREHVRVYRWTGKQAQIRTIRRDEGERQVQMAAEQADRMMAASGMLDSIFFTMTRAK